MDPLASIIPWIVDRKAKESAWWVDHQNGHSEGSKKEAFKFDALYVAGWILTPLSGANVYYPPMWVYGQGKPLTLGDIVGEYVDTSDAPYVKPASPEMNPERVPLFTAP